MTASSDKSGDDRRRQLLALGRKMMLLQQTI
jgi:hypothetical protein